MKCARCGSSPASYDQMSGSVPLCQKHYFELRNKKERLIKEFIGIPKIEEGFKMILDGLHEEFGLDLNDINLVGTPRRYSRMMYELISSTKEIEDQLERLFDSVFSEEYDEIIVVSHIPVYSLCPHHFLPVELEVSVGYLPEKKVLGISKIPRLVKILARQPVLQEAFTRQVSEYMKKYLEPQGVAVLVEGVHSCMRIRGVKSKGKMTTSSMMGVFLTNPSAKDEFFRLIYG